VTVEIDDKTLTHFLVRSFSNVLGTARTPVKKPTVPGTRQSYFQEGALTYLETVAGGATRSQTWVNVFTGTGDAQHIIWAMHIRTEIDAGALERIRIPLAEILTALQKFRAEGFLATLDDLRQGQRTSLFDIPDHEMKTVTGDGLAGVLDYVETITEDLDLFRGDERIQFRYDDKAYGRFKLYTAYFQGGRI